jgi:hypothetical protein
VVTKYKSMINVVIFYFIGDKQHFESVWLDSAPALKALRDQLNELELE